MRLNILCDADWESKVDKVLDTLSDSGYRRFFEEQNYGKELEGVTIVLMCQSPLLNLKQRIRHSKKEKKLYIDIMLDLPKFKEIQQIERENIVIDKIIKEIPPIISKYKFLDFDLPKFEKDLRTIFK